MIAGRRLRAIFIIFEIKIRAGPSLFSPERRDNEINTQETQFTSFNFTVQEKFLTLQHKHKIAYH